MDLTPDQAQVLPATQSIERVRKLEALMMQMPQLEIPVEHLVHGGLYARTAFIPAGTVLTGAMTNADNICIVFGDITVTTDAEPQRLVGFHVLSAKAGAKRVGFAHEDTWWVAVFKTDNTEITDIEDELTSEPEILQTRRLGLTGVQNLEIEQ